MRQVTLDPQAWFTPEELAIALSIDAATVRGWAERGELTHYRYCGRFMFRGIDVETMFARKAAAAENDPQSHHRFIGELR